MVNGKSVTGNNSNATDVTFNNSSTGLVSTNVQSAIYEMDTNLAKKKIRIR